MSGEYTNGSRCLLGQRLDERMTALKDDLGNIDGRLARLEIALPKVEMEVATVRARIGAWAALGAVLGAGIVQVVMRLIFS